MRNTAKTAPKPIGEENANILKELEKIQKNIEEQEAQCNDLEKENQKLKMLQNFNSVFTKTQASKDSVLITQIISELTQIHSHLNKEVTEINRLRKEKAELTGKIGIIEQGLAKIKPCTAEIKRKAKRELSFNDLSLH
jgi:uncharacterized coiled-coil DUF342 family protein